MALVTPGAYGKVTAVVPSSWTVLQPLKLYPERDGLDGELTVLPEKKLPSDTAEPPLELKVTA
jgi:hypothetical protein